MSEATDKTSGPGGGEHIRQWALPSTPRTPRQISTPRRDLDHGETQQLLQKHGDILFNRVRDLMTYQQEQMVTRIVEAISNSIDVRLASNDAGSMFLAADEDVQQKAEPLEHNTVSDMQNLNSQEVFHKNEKQKLIVRIEDTNADNHNMADGNEMTPETFEKCESADAAYVRAMGSFMKSYIKPSRRKTCAEEFVYQIRHMAEHRNVTLPPCQQSAKSFLNSAAYDIVMMCIIIFNTVIIVLEVDSNGACPGKRRGCAPLWLSMANKILLAIYTVEALAIIYAYRLKIFKEKERLFEICVVGSGYVDVLVVMIGRAFPDMTVMRLVRLSRLLRGARLFMFFPELRYIISGFLSAMRAVMWGFLLMMILLMIAAIAAVELMNPLNKQIVQQSERCAEAFSNVWRATVYFFQTIAAGDAWGECSLALIWHNPLCLVFFGGITVFVQIGFLNLIMSVIIDRVQEMRAADRVSRLHQKEKEIDDSRTKWFILFEKLDKDGNGELSTEEVIQGFETLPDFNTDLRLLGIERDHIPHLLELMDVNGNGKVGVDELLSLFDMVSHFDNKMHQVTMGMQMRVMAQHIEHSLKKMSNEVHTLVLQHQRKALIEFHRYENSQKPVNGT